MKKLSARIDDDLLSAAVLGALGLYVVGSSLQLSIGTARSPGAGFFPLLMGAGMVLAALAIALSRLMNGAAAAPADLPAGGRPFAVVLMLAVYAGVLEVVGFPVATVALLLAFSRFIQGQRWRTAALVAIPAVVVFTLLFRSLGVPLPMGALFS